MRPPYHMTYCTYLLVLSHDDDSWIKGSLFFFFFEKTPTKHFLERYRHTPNPTSQSGFCFADQQQDKKKKSNGVSGHL